MQSTTVFIISGEPTVINELTALFKHARLHNEIFTTAESILEQFDPNRPGCLILDMSLQGMGGTELYKMLMQLQSIIPVIILTSADSARSAMEVLKCGAFDFFEKPFDRGALLGAVKHAIEMDSANRHAIRFRAEMLRRLLQLTKREREILESILESKSSREIADQLNMSARTVESHRAKIMKKMGVISLVELVRMATTAFGCHCIHKHKYSQDAQLSSSIFPSSSNNQALRPRMTD